MTTEKEIFNKQTAPFILIDCENQILHWHPGNLTQAESSKSLLTQFKISTSASGLGELEGSHKTPRGWHEIAEKFGEGCALGSVFAAREPTGAVYNTELQAKFPERKDWILSRILRLKGSEQGFNAGISQTSPNKESCDTYCRYIYLHGTNREDLIGIPASIGCVRMRNPDIINLFDKVPIGCPVLVLENLSKECLDAALYRKPKNILGHHLSSFSNYKKN